MSTQGPRSSQMRRPQRVSAHIRIRREAPQNAPFAPRHTPLMISNSSCKGFPRIKRIDFPGVANFRSDKSQYATISLGAWHTMSIRNHITSCKRRCTQEMARDRLVKRCASCLPTRMPHGVIPCRLIFDMNFFWPYPPLWRTSRRHWSSPLIFRLRNLWNLTKMKNDIFGVEFWAVTDFLMKVKKRFSVSNGLLSFRLRWN